MSSLFKQDAKVLIVDDSPAICEDLAQILADLGFKNIKKLGDGLYAWEEVINAANEGVPFEIIFSDINMPQMDGITFLKNLRGTDHYKKTPVFMVSTENIKGTIIKAILSGATDYILKPYDPKLVAEKLLAKL